MRTRLIASLAASAAVLAGAAPAVASGGPVFGQHVAGCARADLGSRAAPPSVVCQMPDGTTMTFANFGAMVHHMREMGV